DNHISTIRKIRSIRGLNHFTSPSHQRSTRPTCIGLKPSRDKLRLTLFVTQNPDPHVALSKVVKEVIGKSFQVTTPKTAGVEVTHSGIGAHLRDAAGKLVKEIIRERS
ncbi:MAG: hypothetical protein NWR99_04515, partial [Verrucomicrobiales bacterium]|nr:hypothetical protein [Verrucomicrobiales bacterium]